MNKILNDPEHEFDFDVADETGQLETANRPVATPHRKESGQATKNLIVEGWRFLAHSYAIVSQWQLLALSRRPDIAVKVRDLPLYAPRWKAQEGLFESDAEQTLRAFMVADVDERADVTLRISFPFDFSPSRSGSTAVFGTAESQIIRRDLLPDLQAYERLHRTPPPLEVKAVTPSNWSAEGFYKAGFRAEQVLIVPHGVDIGTFHPMPDLRGRIRNKIPVAEDDFVFFNAGAMSGNKGIDLLLQAFSQVCRKFPHARLVLKGLDPLYKSKAMLVQNLQTVSAQDQQRVIDRLIYFGKALPFRKMAMLYQAADAYVSPYRAEGFNIPVLEAAASGIPIICTRGGATDDFVTDAFARRIESEKRTVRRKDEDLARLEPDLEHLIVLMSSAIEDHSWRKQAAEAGPRHVRENYTWDRVVDMLTGKLFN
jgi:glycosyltransferase involved in cell wall biosynthesis